MTTHEADEAEAQHCNPRAPRNADRPATAPARTTEAVSA